MKPILSILICSINGRESYLDALLQNIQNQTKSFEKEVEVIVCKDNKDRSIGNKRNELLQGCTGEWACFIDDDDQIANDYIPRAIKILKEQNPDCINLTGVITTDGKNPTTFIHELKHKEYFTVNYGLNSVYYRPPNHLNIIRTSISKNFKFPELSHGEDTDWAMQICNAGVLKTEGRIDGTVYFYNYISNK